MLCFFIQSDIFIQFFVLLVSDFSKPEPCVKLIRVHPREMSIKAGVVMMCEASSNNYT